MDRNCFSEFFSAVGAMKMSAYAEPAESTETAEITESSTGAGLSDMDFGMGDGRLSWIHTIRYPTLGLVTAKRYRARLPLFTVYACICP